MLGLQGGSTIRRLLSAFAVAALVSLSLTSCSGLDSPEVPVSTRPSLGELVYRVIKGQLQQSDSCPNELLAQLETHHSDFVASFDHVIETGVTDDFPDLLGGTIKPFIDNDKLPRLVDALAKTLALLVSDEFDPNRETIAAMVHLTEAQTLIESSVAIRLVAAILTDDTIPDKVHALATIAQENDGVTYLMDDVLDVASYALEADPTPSVCTGLVSPNAQTTLLRTDGFVEDPRFALGSPFYLARPDANGNPAVLNDDGVLRGPFVDANHDLVADVDTNLEPVDASGAPIDLDMIGEDDGTGRDEFGRAYDSQGRLVYDYYDVKRTALSYSLQIGADLLATDVHHELPPIIDAVLGEPTTCADGANCRVYPSAGNVVADLTWLAFELAEYGRISVLARTLTDLLTIDETKAEQLLVAVGDIIRALDATDLQLTDTTLTDAGIGLIPLLGQIFTTPSAGAQPTARVLVDVLEGLGEQADALPEELNYMLRIQYDADAPGQTESVDLSKPRFPAGGDDNRTGLEQVIELFEYADCGRIGPDSSALGINIRNLLWLAIHGMDENVQEGTVAEVFVSLLADQKPDVAISLINFLTGATSIPGASLLVGNVIEAVGCPAARASKTASHLPALSVLADSGGLDWMLAIAKTFRDQGELRLLVDIFGFIGRELRADEDAYGSTYSAIRRLAPALVSMTTRAQADVPYSTPLNRVLDMLDILLTIESSDGSGSALDVMIDALEYMTKTRTIETRPVTGTTPGTTSSSFAILFLNKLKTLQTAVTDGSAGASLTRLVDSITPLLTSTTGSGVSRRLANPNLRLLAATFTSIIADATSLSPAEYLCYLHDLQSESTQFMTSKHFATSVRILKHLAISPSAVAIEDWLGSLLRGNADRSVEVYGPGLQLAAGALSSNASSEDLSQILDWLGAGLTATGTGGVREVVQTFDELLTSDSHHSMITMARSMLAPGPLASHERPITTFVNTATDVGAVDSTNACMASGGTIDPVALEDFVQGMTDFLHRDSTDGTSSGIEQVWSLVGSIAPAE